MDNAGSVRFRQTFGGVLQEPEQLSEFSVLLMNLLAQGYAVNELHGDEVHAVALADLMDGRDVRMIERRRRLRFLNKTPHPVLIGGQVGRKNFQRNFPIEFRVLGQIHLAHPARADLRDDAVMRQFGIFSKFLVHLDSKSFTHRVSS